MSPSRRVTRMLTLAILVFGVPVLAQALPPLGYSPHFCAIWNVSPSANLPQGDSSLGAIAAVNANDMWAVGSALNGTRHTLAEHWNGASWSVVSTPDGPQPTNLLLAVDAVSTGDVWAAGFSASSNPFDPQSQTLVLHWGGSGWSAVASPNPTMPGGGDSANELYGVAAAGPGDVWVVGKTNDFTSSQSLILHWDGLEWTDMSTPDDGDNGWLTAVEVVAPDDVWAVGFNSVDFLQVNLIKHWDGESWTNVEAPNVGPFVNQLQAVSATAPNSVWAVGFHLEVFGVNQVYQTSVLHWDGSEWSVVPSPNRSQLNNYLFDVVGVASGNAWAVGFWDNGSQLLTMIQHWDGFTWNVISNSPNASDSLNELTGVVSVGPDQAWAIGQEFDFFNWQTLAVRLSCPGSASTRTVRR